MNTGLQDITGKRLKIGDTIVMCSYNYSLEEFGQANKEYRYCTGVVFFGKGKVYWNGTQDYEHKLYDNNFLIIIRDKKLLIKVDDNWNWNDVDISSSKKAVWKNKKIT